MTTGQRLRLYLMGFLIGCVLVYFMLFRGTNRSYWFPSNRVKEQVNKCEFRYSERAKCRMNCKQIMKEEVEEVLKNGEVNFSESDVRGAAVPSYAIDGKTSSGKNLRVVVTIFEIDSMAEITTAINLMEDADTCACR